MLRLGLCCLLQCCRCGPCVGVRLFKEASGSEKDGQQRRAQLECAFDATRAFCEIGTICTCFDAARVFFFFKLVGERTEAGPVFLPGAFSRD